MLTDQGSNLDSSEPKSDVLPITPSVMNDLRMQKYKIICLYKRIFQRNMKKNSLNCVIYSLPKKKAPKKGAYTLNFHYWKASKA